MSSRTALAAVLVAGCAASRPGGSPDAPPAEPVDAPAIVDARIVPRPDARPIDAAPPPPDARAPDSACAAELLGNGDFDSTIVSASGKDISPWMVVTQGAPRPFVVGTADELFSAAFIQPQSGDFAAWLGGDNDVDHRLQQTVAFPANTTGARFRGAIQIRSDENPIPVNDRLRISLYDAAGTTEVELLAAFSEEDVTVGWTAVDVPVLGSYAGMTLQLRVAATTDSSKITSFFVDTLSVAATICP
jgi:hypothetical protein